MIKELRETVGLLVVASLLAAYFLAALTGTPLLPWQQRGVQTVPFVHDSLSFTLWLIGGGLAVMLGLKQTAWEVGWGTYYFLFHRPIERWKLFALKLAVGVGVVLGVVGLMVLAYALWASTPGAHDAPFFWSMTVGAWREWSALPMLYLGAFLSGIRPARWFGTKLAPLAGAILITIGVAHAEPWWLSPLFAIAWVAATLPAIFYYVRQRDY